MIFQDSYFSLDPRLTVHDIIAEGMRLHQRTVILLPVIMCKAGLLDTRLKRKAGIYMDQFDQGINRKGTNCVKWDVPFVTEKVIPMWIADMDFATAPAVTERLKKAAAQGAFGYQFLSDQYYDAVIQWMDRRHHYQIEKDWICFLPNVVMALSAAVQAVSEPGDEIIIQTPVYGPFYKTVKDNDRVLIESRLKNQDGYYTMDLEDFESKITPKTKAAILCNPHNPSGRVWTYEELKAFTEICLKHQLYIISDEIHCELLTKGHPHTVISTISKETAKRSIICTSPSKAFNLAAIHVANCVIENEELRVRFQELAEKTHAAECNAFAEAALIGAYNESEQWLDELNEYIEGNLDYFVGYVEKNIKKLKVCRPEGTYLLWVDCRELGIPYEKIHDFFLNVCNVAVNDGEFFGEEGKGFVRFNAACPRKNLEIALDRMKKEIDKLGE